MDDKDVMKQNDGARQGNIHTDRDRGENEAGHPGSTLESGSNSGQVLEKDERAPRQEPATPGQQNDETLGIP